MDYLADTNILARRVIPSDPIHAVISAALLTLHRRGDTVHIAPQSLIEFQALATRPVKANGMGMSPAQVSAEALALEAVFPMLPETPAIYPLWRSHRLYLRGGRPPGVRRAACCSHASLRNHAHSDAEPGGIPPLRAVDRNRRSTRLGVRIPSNSAR